ncbi:MAG TPA: ATP-dependent Clp protease proteolytic subunit [Candidatus Saccharimonadales bacterium]|nr:ATP-dependent Clp protease proteolytic subunit [Candidatus Saccharimonadales bacterium]
MPSDVLVSPLVKEGQAGDGIQASYRPPGPAWFSLETEGDFARLRIFGEIGIYGSRVEDCIGQLGNAERVEVVINSIGGDCDAAFRLADALRQRKVTAEIHGSCFSAAVIVALAADTIRIEASARMMIHPVRQFVFGDSEEVLCAAVNAERYRTRLRWQILQRIRDDVLADKWLSGAADFYFTATEAVKLGLADEVFSIPAPAVSPVSAPADVQQPAQTEDEMMFWDFLRAFGKFAVADKDKFLRDVSLWMKTHTTGLQK